jgi:selenocysteine lyase/cysteine desulfurase
VGLIAASLPDGGRVAVQRGEFTSVTAPFAVQSDRGVEVHQLEPGELEEQASAFDLVAVSVVQSSDGRVLDLERLRSSVAGSGTRVLLDVTQAAGWMHLDLSWADVVVAAGYKWLLSPRGTAWMSVSHDFAATLTPHTTGWYSSETPWANTYAHPPLLAADARRFDLSPAWHPMLGAGIALPWLAGLDLHAVERHCTGLADRVREAAGLEPAGSAIVALDVPGLADELEREGIRAAQRAGRVRVGFHLYNTADDADALIAALRRVR